MSEALALIVDDEVQIRRFLRAGLELDGFLVEEAENGTEALKLATLKAADIVILDLGLPDMDGSEVLERLRGWSTVPVIVLSVRDREEDKIAGLKHARAAIAGARRRRHSTRDRGDGDGASRLGSPSGDRHDQERPRN